MQQQQTHYHLGAPCSLWSAQSAVRMTHSCGTRGHSVQVGGGVAGAGEGDGISCAGEEGEGLCLLHRGGGLCLRLDPSDAAACSSGCLFMLPLPSSSPSPPPSSRPLSEVVPDLPIATTWGNLIKTVTARCVGGGSAGAEVLIILRTGGGCGGRRKRRDWQYGGVPFATGRPQEVICVQVVLCACIPIRV